MLYIKYKNFQRLRIESEVGLIKSICNSHFKTNLDLVDLNIFFEFNAEKPLSHFWIRQSNILMIESLVKNNHSLVKWLDNIGTDPGHIRLNVDRLGTPRILQGDFKDSISKSQETFFRDSFIREKSFMSEFTFKYIDDMDILDVDVSVIRTLTNSKEIPIHGFFAALGEKGLESGIQLMTCKVDDLDVFSDIKFW
jgi:hypothetical protein